MHPADVEAIARRSAELVLAALADAPQPSGRKMVDAATIAQRFTVDRGWVYAHADELGAVRLGDGARLRLRFDLETVGAALSACEASETSSADATPVLIPSPGRRHRRPAAASAHLLPIRGDAA